MENTTVGIVLDETPEIQMADAEALIPYIQKMRSVGIEMSDMVPLIHEAGDQLPEGSGEFGTNPNNPIPVNGPTGLLVYLNTLRSNRDRPFAQTYEGTVQNQLANRIVDAVFLQELTGESPREFFLFFCMYSKHRSRKLPPFCYRVPMESSIPGSAWQLGYKQPFMLKISATVPLLGIGNSAFGSAGIMKRENTKWAVFLNTDSKHLKRVAFDSVHAVVLVNDWFQRIREQQYVLEDEARLKKLSESSAEDYWAETFGRDVNNGITGSGATPDDPILLRPMNNLGAAATERFFLGVFFGIENKDWIGEERRYPGGALMEYHVRLKSGQKHIIYFDLSRLNEKIDNTFNRVTNPIIEQALGKPIGDTPPRIATPPVILKNKPNESKLTQVLLGNPVSIVVLTVVGRLVNWLAKTTGVSPVVVFTFFFYGMLAALLLFFLMLYLG
jgi:hypothetical protein